MTLLLLLPIAKDDDVTTIIIVSCIFSPFVEDNDDHKDNNDTSDGACNDPYHCPCNILTLVSVSLECQR